MARTTSYGMGQYRYNNNYNYLTELTIPKKDYQYYLNNDYQDVYIKLPIVDNNAVVQYGRTFYMRLTIPQNNQYNLKLNLKLCAGDSNSGTAINTNRFQQIKQLIVPPTSNLNDNAFSPVILYEVPEGQSLAAGDQSGDVKVHLWDKEHRYDLNDGNNPSFFVPGDIYLMKDSNRGEEYRYYFGTNINDYILMDDKFFTPVLPQNWKLKENNSSTITYDFIFSPKYNLTGGYPFLLIETDRSGADQQSIQYIDSKDKNTYYGTILDKEKIDLKLYHVSNLLEGGSSGVSQIQSGTNTLTHIGVWGHPEQLLDINGEEIRIGQSGFYELNDFTINELGVVVDPDDPIKDRFTIDYEYKIIS